MKIEFTKSKPKYSTAISLFLCKATLREYLEFLRCLKLYGEASGQEINFQKSAISFGGNIDPFAKRLISNILDIDKEGGTGTYLRLPECFSGSKQELLAFIGEKLSKRLKGWYAKMLSLGGKEILLKSVAMALPVYAMTCFRLTKHQCQKITSAMMDFWWNVCEKKRRIHWVAWKDLCKSKADGGLGFRDIETFNQALLAKQAWRVLNEPESLLARLYKGRYFQSKDFLSCGVGYSLSYAWRSIIHGRELLQQGLMKSIGNGNSTKIWSEKWLFDTRPKHPANAHSLIDLEENVASLLAPDKTWLQSRVYDLFIPDDARRVMQTPTRDVQDRLIWAFTKHGSYTVKSGHWLASSSNHVRDSALPPEDLARLELKRRSWKIKNNVEDQNVHVEGSLRSFSSG